MCTLKYKVALAFDKEASWEWLDNLKNTVGLSALPWIDPNNPKTISTLTDALNKSIINPKQSGNAGLIIKRIYTNLPTDSKKTLVKNIVNAPAVQSGISKYINDNPKAVWDIAKKWWNTPKNRDMLWNKTKGWVKNNGLALALGTAAIPVSMLLAKKLFFSNNNNNQTPVVNNNTYNTYRGGYGSFKLPSNIQQQLYGR